MVAFGFNGGLVHVVLRQSAGAEHRPFLRRWRRRSRGAVGILPPGFSSWIHADRSASGPRACGIPGWLHPDPSLATAAGGVLLLARHGVPLEGGSIAQPPRCGTDRGSGTTPEAIRPLGGGRAGSGGGHEPLP